jgi:hypothetical protein
VTDPRAKTDTTILVMQSRDCCLPCHAFASRGSDHKVLSSDDLQRLFAWAATVEDEVPDLYFLAGTTTALEPDMAGWLADLADHVLTPLMPLQRQTLLGIPFSPRQTAVADSLRELMEHAADIAGRPVVVHLERGEIDHLAERLWSIRGAVGALTIRVRDANLLNENDLRQYESQMSALVEKSVPENNIMRAGAWEIRNLSPTHVPGSAVSRCPAGTSMFVFGPDGRFYPCPAFFLAAAGGPGLTFAEMDSRRRHGSASAPCRICRQDSCPGCHFLETVRQGKDRLCRLSQAEQRASQWLWRRAARLPYYFDQMRTLRTTSCALRSQEDGRGFVAANLQTCCVDFPEFVHALQDIWSAARLLANNPQPARDYEPVVARWADLEGVPPSSQRGVFRRRARDILQELLDLRRVVVQDHVSVVKPGDGEACGAGTTSGCPLAPQALTAAACAEIGALHYRRLGWMYLLRHTEEDRRAGFFCAEQEEVLRRKLQDACAQVSRWFEATGAAEKWPYAAGWIWEVDFVHSKVVPRPSSLPAARPDPPPELREGPLMEVSDVDIDIIRRLFERRGATADRLRAQLRHVPDVGAGDQGSTAARINVGQQGAGGMPDRAGTALDPLAKELGLAQQDVEAWFGEMAVIHGWPPIHPPWQYRVDFTEHRVYLERART